MLFGLLREAEVYRLDRGGDCVIADSEKLSSAFRLLINRRQTPHSSYLLPEWFRQTPGIPACKTKLIDAFARRYVEIHFFSSFFSTKCVYQSFSGTVLRLHEFSFTALKFICFYEAASIYFSGCTTRRSCIFVNTCCGKILQKTLGPEN